jgi:hypothetical protein
MTAEGKLGEAGQKLEELKGAIEKLNTRQQQSCRGCALGSTGVRGIWRCHGSCRLYATGPTLLLIVATQDSPRTHDRPFNPLRRPGHFRFGYSCNGDECERNDTQCDLEHLQRGGT